MSRRPRWAAVVTSLALLTAYGAQSLLHAEAAATNSQVMPDPSGDANNLVDANGGATAVPNEPRADIVTATAAYQASAIVFSVKMAQPVNPATDAGWGASDVTWFVDTTGDKKYDASIEFGADGGKLYAEVYNPSDQQICTGAGLTPTPSIGPDQSYIVSVPPRCFGNPSGFYWGGRSEFAQGDKNVMDRFPDGDGNYFGPVSLQTTPPPTTPGST
ncbi:MAG: hypothetical protein LC792_25345, partial [Actinobacteria bacterium]|nr:hypothetical protein [Actinomycetota bacterium]